MSKKKVIIVGPAFPFRGGIANFNTALSDGSFATIAGTEILTNKTLTSPVINTPTGDVATKSDSDAVRRAVRNIVMTNYYERPFKPSLGGNIRGLLFELDTDRKLNRAKRRLKEAIEDFEPRVSNVRCVFQTEGNSLDVTVFYNIKNGLSNQELQFTVNRTR